MLLAVTAALLWEISCSAPAHGSRQAKGSNGCILTRFLAARLHYALAHARLIRTVRQTGAAWANRPGTAPTVLLLTTGLIVLGARGIGVPPEAEARSSTTAS